MGTASVTGAALYYLVVSTLGVSALFFLAELLERGRTPGAAMIAITAEAFFDPEEDLDPEEEVGIAIPATMAVLGVAFACCAIMLAGLPPLAGFIGKFALLHALLSVDPVSGVSWIMLVMLIVSGFATLIAMGRAGVRRFWAPRDENVPRVRAIEMAPVLLLLALCVVLTIKPGAAMRYVDDAAQALHAPRAYIDQVLSSP
jgi:multicomponent K+:H+ antiporter subunit D